MAQSQLNVLEGADCVNILACHGWRCEWYSQNYNWVKEHYVDCWEAKISATLLDITCALYSRASHQSTDNTGLKVQLILSQYSVFKK